MPNRNGMSAAIWKDEPECVFSVLPAEPRWRVQLSLGPNQRKNARTSREAIAWCKEMGIPFVVVNPPTREESK